MDPLVLSQSGSDSCGSELPAGRKRLSLRSNPSTFEKRSSLRVKAYSTVKSVSFLLTPDTDCEDRVMERGDNGAASVQKEEEVFDGGSGRRKRGEKRKALKNVTARQPNSCGSRKGSRPVLEGRRRSSTRGRSKALPINPFNKPSVENLIKSGKSFLQVITNFSLCHYLNGCIVSIV